ncbi:MAG: cell division protein FtsL [Gammaproteobacteria bacterium]|nr:cell division protein FtsL [Gammaproteobacteria bacterium]
MTRLLLLAVLGALVFLSALQVVTTRYETRLLVMALQALKTQRDDLEREWTQLLLEQSTWSTHGRVETLARSKLNMILPRAAELKHIRS